MHPQAERSRCSDRLGRIHSDYDMQEACFQVVERMTTLKILFSEGSSLTARKFLSVLGPAGHYIEIVDSNPLCICRFSRWTKRVHRCPPAGRDPLGYLETINRLLTTDAFDVLLPTHEQAWLFAAAATRLDSHGKIVLASAEAFSRVESKLEFARLLDELSLPQPKWSVIESVEQLADWPTPFYLKAPFSTAGMGVRRVAQRSQAEAAFQSLVSIADGGSIMVQSAVEGKYTQVQALFDHGRLIAVHTSTQTAVGIGPSAAGRMSVNHPFAQRDIALVGKRLGWHGGLTMDYLFRDEEHFYIECNPRTVEPANAAASGVNLPELQLALSLGEKIEGLRIGRPGVRTHSALVILLGTAAYRGTRKALIFEMLRLITHQGVYEKSCERLTPVFADLPSLIPLAMSATRSLMLPRSVERLASAAVKNYSITSETIKHLSRNFIDGSLR